MNKKIGIVTGSLRKGAFSKSVAKFVAENLPSGFEAEFIEIGHLPLYNQDYDVSQPPESYAKFREEIKSLDAVLFVTPEHNRSFPAALKNALDIGSRPYGQNVWGGKPGGIISVSPGNAGGFGANHHLRQVLTFLNVYTLAQPEMYVSGIKNSLDESGNVNEERTSDYLKSFIDAFTQWINKF